MRLNASIGFTNIPVTVYTDMGSNAVNALCLYLCVNLSYAPVPVWPDMRRDSVRSVSAILARRSRCTWRTILTVSTIKSW